MSEHSPAELTGYLNQIISRNQDSKFLQELLTMSIVLEQEFYKIRRQHHEEKN